jgi:hypothetical protein
MRNKVLIRVVAGCALLVGLALGTLLGGQRFALASGGANPGNGSANQQKYCKVYVTTLASNLNVTVPELAAANKSALQTTIKQAYTDGAITQAQVKSLLDKVNQLGKDPCADLARLAATHHKGHELQGAHQAIVNAVAGALKLSPATLESDLSSGQTVAQIASAQHVRISDVNAVYLTAVQTQLKAAVTRGLITQSQSHDAYSAIQRAVSNGKYPLLRADT